MSNKQRGFTILELMIATTVFSLVLMVTLAGIIQITKMYYRGVTLVNTQEVGRTVIDEIGEAVRFSSESIAYQSGAPGSLVIGPEVAHNASDDTNYFCLGSKRYTYAIDRQVKRSPASNTKEKHHALWIDQPPVCDTPANLDIAEPSANGVELLAENMRLTRFDINKVAGVNNAYRINIGVAYGDDDLLSLSQDGLTKTCEGAFYGAEFCAVSNLSVTVGKRL